MRLTVAVEATGPGALPARRARSDAGDLAAREVDALGNAADPAAAEVDPPANAAAPATDTGGNPTDGLVSVSLRETSRTWRTGDRLALRSRLRRVSGFGNFGELDWAAYNARRGVFVTAYAWRDEDVTVLAAADGVVDGLRRRFAEACARVGGQGAEILEALVIGDRVGIERPVSDAVRDAGLAHFLAISGSHMALIVVLVVALVRSAAGLSTTLLERYDVLRAAALLAALAVVAYGAVSGGGVSVARSVLMALAAMAALWRGRPGDDLRALGGSAIVLAAIMPGVGEEAGFQLSYLAVLALILHARRRREVRQAARLLAEGRPRGALYRVLDVTLEAVQVALLCWAVTTPVVAQHFNRISVVS
ncbi:MAG: ComEC/Rec2 family competence protein, partial [Thioalkalivibrio sp.]|nr:ComEC/Rec2 family competence protein [Thioalkalivibrio sp.]